MDNSDQLGLLSFFSYRILLYSFRKIENLFLTFSRIVSILTILYNKWLKILEESFKV